MPYAGCSFFVGLLCVVATSSAQIRGMATDSTGSRLFFTTELSQTGSTQPGYGKLFVAAGSGIMPALIYNRDSQELVISGRTSSITNFYNISGVDVSSDRAYLAVAALRRCGGSSTFCRYVDQTSVYDAQGKVVFQIPGEARLSPKGKWALGVATLLDGPPTNITLYDVTTGTPVQSTSITTVNRDARAHDVADNGTTVLALDFQGIKVMRPAGTSLTIQPDGNVRSVRINADGRIVVWEQVDRNGQHSLAVSSTADLQTTMSLRVSGWSDSQPTLSDDGSIILCVSTPAGYDNPQAFVMNIDGTQRRQISRESDGVASAVLSGNGRVVWLLTRTGRLVRLDAAASGQRLDLAGPLAAFLRPVYFPGTQITPSVDATPGEVLSLPASVMPGEAVAISVDGIPAGVLNVDVQSVTFQTPWNIATTSPRDVEVRINKPGTPSWTGNTFQMSLTSARPRLLAITHEDFRAVRPGAAVRAGETVHAFGTGLGAVMPAMINGSITPGSPLFQTAHPVACAAGPIGDGEQWNMEILFAGLAPGFVGLYQRASSVYTR